MAGLAAGAAGQDRGDLVVVEAEDLAEHIVGVLTQAGRRQAGPIVVAPDPELVAFVGDLPHLGVFEAPEERTMGQLRIHLVITRALHHAGGHAGGLQPAHQFERLVLDREGGHLAVDQSGVVQPPGRRVELRVGRPRRVAQHSPEGSPLVVVLDRDGAPLIDASARVDVVR